MRVAKPCTIPLYATPEIKSVEELKNCPNCLALHKTVIDLIKERDVLQDLYNKNAELIEEYIEDRSDVLEEKTTIENQIEVKTKQIEKLEQEVKKNKLSARLEKLAKPKNPVRRKD